MSTDSAVPWPHVAAGGAELTPCGRCRPSPWRGLAARISNFQFNSCKRWRAINWLPAQAPLQCFACRRCHATRQSTSEVWSPRLSGEITSPSKHTPLITTWPKPQLYLVDRRNSCLCKGIAYITRGLNDYTLYLAILYTFHHNSHIFISFIF